MRTHSCAHTCIHTFFLNKSTSRPLTNEDFLFGVVISIFPYNRSNYIIDQISGGWGDRSEGKNACWESWGQEVRSLAPTCMPGVATTMRGRDRRVVGLCRLPASLQSQWENCLEKITQKMAEPATQCLLLASTRTWVCAPAHACAYTSHTLSLSHTKYYWLLIYFHCLGCYWSVQLQQSPVNITKDMKSGYLGFFFF